jgi:ABC-type dipeptide/oligopeptide/nickel transport system permease component
VLVFIGRRLAESIPVLVLASMVVFSMMHLVPGDPVDAMMGAAAFQGAAKQELVEQVRVDLPSTIRGWWARTERPV